MHAPNDTRIPIKVPAVTFLFWVITIAATTLGETGGDAVSMSMHLGYLVSTLLFAVGFLLAVTLQMKSSRFRPLIYWTTLIATTTVGTTLADFVDRSLGIGYSGGTVILVSLLLSSLFIWYRALGTISVSTIKQPKAQFFYWITLLFSQTLGTALGDWTADTAGLGYRGGALLFSLLLGTVAALHFWTRISSTFLFWVAFVLTRPLGAVVGDFLDKPVASGGLNMSRYTASAVLLAFILLCIFIFPNQNSAPAASESNSRP